MFWVSDQRCNTAGSSKRNSEPSRASSSRMLTLPNQELYAEPHNGLGCSAPLSSSEDWPRPHEPHVAGNRWWFCLREVSSSEEFHERRALRMKLGMRSGTWTRDSAFALMRRACSPTHRRQSTTAGMPCFSASRMPRSSSRSSSGSLGALRRSAGLLAWAMARSNPSQMGESGECTPASGDRVTTITTKLTSLRNALRWRGLGRFL
eukprot:scaffold35915_cov69-Phaeocystis_antarctica.AAC.1